MSDITLFTTILHALMAFVAVIGAGDVGAAVAQALATRDRVSRVLLVDAAVHVAAGKALDIQQSGAVSGFHARLEGTDDLTRVMGAAACVVADRYGQPPAEWAGDEAAPLIRSLLPCAGEAPLIFAGPSQAGLMHTVSREHHVPRARLIGSSPEAFASAIRSMIALEARCSPAEVVLAVLGVPPRGLVVPWSEAAVGGFALERVLSPVQLARLAARTARLWPPGPYALGLAAALAAEAVVRSSRRALNVLTLLDGEFGVRNRAGTLPALLDRRGVAEVRVPSLSTRERVLVDSALAG
jgi:malate dehydrogenase